MISSKFGRSCKIIVTLSGSWFRVRGSWVHTVSKYILPPKLMLWSYSLQPHAYALVQIKKRIKLSL